MKILNIALTVALSALIGTSFASTTVYKSVGKNGEVRFSQMQPNDTKNFEVIQIRSDGRQASAGQMAQIPDATAAPAPSAEAQRLAEMEKQLAEQKATALARDCQAMRANLANLSTGGRTYETNAQGERVYLNDQEVSARRQQTMDAINKNCNGRWS